MNIRACLLLQMRATQIQRFWCLFVAAEQQQLYFHYINVQNTNATNYYFLNELNVKLITCHCTSVAETEEGASTKRAGTVAVNGNPLDLFDCSNTAGPGIKGHHLVNSDSE